MNGKPFVSYTRHIAEFGIACLKDSPIVWWLWQICEQSSMFIKKVLLQTIICTLLSFLWTFCILTPYSFSLAPWGGPPSRISQLQWITVWLSGILRLNLILPAWGLLRVLDLLDWVLLCSFCCASSPAYSQFWDSSGRSVRRRIEDGIAICAWNSYLHFIVNLPAEDSDPLQH